MAIATDAALLTLAQWLSPAYPVGAFSYSHGLESEVQAGRVTDANALREWLFEILDHGAGRADATFLAAASQAGDPARLAEIDATCRAFAAAAERLRETDQQGAAFCAVTEAVWAMDLGALCYPVAVGRAARMMELPALPTAAMYLQAFAGNLIGAALRLLPLGQTAGQALLRDLTPRCQQIAQETANSDLSNLSSTVFLADIAAMRHETQYSRIFRT